MKRNEYISLFNEWNNFLISENKEYNSYSLERLDELIEWGDNLERLMNENLDFYLLESHFINEGIFSSFRKAKDKVKSFFSQGLTKEKIDDNGNIVRKDLNDKESAAVKEYTTLTKSVAALVLAAKLATIISGSMISAGAINADGQDSQNKAAIEIMNNANNFDANENDMKTALKIATTPDGLSFTIPQPENVKISPAPESNSSGDSPSIEAGGEGFKITSIPNETKQKIAEELLSGAAENSGNSLEDIKKMLADDGNSHEEFNRLINDPEGKLDAAAVAHGVDLSNGSIATKTVEEIQDLSDANKLMNDFINASNLKGLKISQEKIKSGLDSFKPATFKVNMKKLGKQGREKLFNAARIYTLKKLKSENPDLFKNADMFMSKISIVSGGNTGEKGFSQQTQKGSGTKEAKILAALYSGLDKVVQKYIDSTDAKTIQSELEGSFKYSGFKDTKSGIAAKVVEDFMTFVLANAGSDADNIDNILTVLNNNSSLNFDVSKATQVLTKYHEKGDIGIKTGSSK